MIDRASSTISRPVPPGLTFSQCPLTRRPPRYANPGLEINGVEKDYDNGEYGPKLINDFALDFVTRHKDRPFFLYYPMILTHDPFQPTPDSKDWDSNAMGEKVHQDKRHFGEMVTYMDKLIGRLVMRHGLTSSRQAVSQHLDVLEAAGLVRTRRQGRYKFHDLTPEPLERIAARWPTSDSRRPT